MAFQAGTGIGLTVALAVIAHDFADGLNTVTLMMVNHNSRRRSVALLAADALAPVIGAASTLLFTVPDGTLRLYLGFFAGQCCSTSRPATSCPRPAPATRGGAR